MYTCKTITLLKYKMSILIIIAASLLIISCSDDKKDRPNTPPPTETETPEKSTEKDQDKTTESTEESEASEDYKQPTEQESAEQVNPQDEQTESTDDEQKSQETETETETETLDSKQLMAMQAADEIKQIILAKYQGKNTEDIKTPALDEIESDYQSMLNNIQEKITKRKNQIQSYLKQQLGERFGMSLAEQENLSEEEMVDRYIEHPALQAPFHTDEGIQALIQHHIKNYVLDSVFESDLNINQVNVTLKFDKTVESPDSLVNDEVFAPQARLAFEKINKDNSKPLIIGEGPNKDSETNFTYDIINDVSGVRSQTNGTATIDIFLNDGSTITITDFKFFLTESKNLIIAKTTYYSHPSLFQAFKVNFLPENIVIEYSQDMPEQNIFEMNIHKKMGAMQEQPLEQAGIFVAHEISIIPDSQLNSVENVQAYRPNFPKNEASLFDKLKDRVLSWFNQDKGERMITVQKEIDYLKEIYIEHRESYLAKIDNKYEIFNKFKNQVKKERDEMIALIQSDLKNTIQEYKQVTEEKYNLIVKEITKSLEKLSPDDEASNAKLEEEKQQNIEELQNRLDEKQAELEEQLEQSIKDLSENEPHQAEDERLNSIIQKIKHNYKPEETQ